MAGSWPAAAYFRRNADGKVTRYTFPQSVEDERDAAYLAGFWLTDGNFGCDCNRDLSVRRALGEDEETPAVTCADGRFDILYLRVGSVVEIGDAEPAASDGVYGWE